MVDRSKWSALHPGCVAFRKEPLYPLIGGCMDLRVDKIDSLEKKRILYPHWDSNLRWSIP